MTVWIRPFVEYFYLILNLIIISYSDSSLSTFCPPRHIVGNSCLTKIVMDIIVNPTEEIEINMIVPMSKRVRKIVADPRKENEIIMVADRDYKDTSNDDHCEQERGNRY